MTSAAVARGRALRWLAPAGIALAVAALAWSVAYLCVATPGRWLGGAASARYDGSQMKLSRGSGRVDGPRVVVLATDEAGLAIVSLDLPSLAAADYRRIRWQLSGGEAEGSLAVLWRTDKTAGKINSAPLDTTSSGAQALFTPGQGNWDGNIEGIALAVHGKLKDPLVIEGVVVEPMGMADMVSDRLRDWFGFTAWSGLSINAALGGPVEQPVWLSLAVTIIALTALALCVGWRRWRKVGASAQFPLTLIAIAVAAWVALDARWLWGRLQQTEATAVIFSGKTLREKHVADVDGYVYAFAEQVHLRLPKTPARVYVTADDHYFGARLTYHLYPHNAYYDHVSGTLPASAQCKPGEYIVVFRRHGVQYDRAEQMLRWDDQPPVRAQLLLAHLGNAVFKLL